jgi:hypothetical protein
MLEYPGFDSQQGQNIVLKCPDPYRGPPSFLSTDFQKVFPHGLTAGTEFDSLFPLSVEVKNEWSYSSTPFMPSWFKQGPFYLYVSAAKI